MSSNVDLNIRPGYDSVISEIADYVSNFKIESDLAHNPGKHKELKGSSGIFSYRIGTYRIIYTIEDGNIIIAKVGHRKDIYE